MIVLPIPDNMVRDCAGVHRRSELLGSFPPDAERKKAYPFPSMPSMTVLKVGLGRISFSAMASTGR
jgi:hypothetical protein